VKNYTLQKEFLPKIDETDAEEEQKIRYFWNPIVVVIKNVPVLPYVTKSANITVTVMNRTVSGTTGGQV